MKFSGSVWPWFHSKLGFNPHHDRALHRVAGLRHLAPPEQVDDKPRSWLARRPRVYFTFSHIKVTTLILPSTKKRNGGVV
jgi:hypothetical protein